MFVNRIVSGGQSGVDIAALDVAIALGIDYGGWIPKGRMNEYGPIDEKYLYLVECNSEENIVRTELNVRDSDATIILTSGKPCGGTEDTLLFAANLGKPVFQIDICKNSIEYSTKRLSDWILRTEPYNLNIAGPRESEVPGINEKATLVLTRALSAKPLPLDKGTDVTVAATLFAEARANFRHWDQIRWFSPYWFCVLSSATAVLIATVSVEESVVRVLSGFNSFFGILCLVLINRVGKYHTDSEKNLRRHIFSIVKESNLRTALSHELPFDFVGNNRWKTATWYFSIFIWIITLISACVAVFGPWWKI